jgi:hypothetical protein
MARLTVALPLALQLLACVAPANALILCVSDDGCVEVELAQPGTRRCVETDCDDGHAVDASHGCRDIPILGQAIAPARATATLGGGPGALPPAMLPRVAHPTSPIALLSSGAAAPRDGTARRTVVLQL